MILPLLGCLVLLFGGAGAVWWWDRHEPIGWHTHILWKRVGFSLPNSLATQRDMAVAALGPCRQNAATLQGLIAKQNAAMDAYRADSAAMDRRIAQGAQAAGKAAAAAMLRSQRILAVQTDGPDRCAAYDAVDAAVVAGLGK
jgi:hypothetical protein